MSALDQAKAILDEFKVTCAKLGASQISERVTLPQGAVQVPEVVGRIVQEHLIGGYVVDEHAFGRADNCKKD